MWKFVQTYVQEYNTKCDHQESAHIIFKDPTRNGNDFIIANSTPVMTRARKYYPQEQKYLFVDSTGSLDQYDLVVTLFVIATNVGALPIGLTIAGGKSQDTYTEAFKMLQRLTADIHQDSCFNPSIGMTDLDKALCNALRACGQI